MRIGKILGGLLFSFAVGFGCKLAAIPVPSPPVLSGAVLVFMMSTGYWLVDRHLARRARFAQEQAS
jgi:XapX domain-containing protein